MPAHRRGGAPYDSARVTVWSVTKLQIQRILGSQLRRMEVVQAMLPAETSARLTMVERLQAILGSNRSLGPWASFSLIGKN